MDVTTKMLSKKELRETFLEKRNQLTSIEVVLSQAEVIKAIKEDPNFINSKYIGLYMPINNEMDLNEIKKHFPNKVYAYPTVEKNELVFYSEQEDSYYSKSNFGVIEIQEGVNVTDKLEYILVPAIAMSPTHYRLGYGKGYFDKFFKNKDKVIKVGICYKFAVTNFETENHDIQLNYSFIG